MKILLIVLDGLGDLGKETPLSRANKPNIDSLVQRGITGLLNIGYKKDVNSDFGFLTILSSYSDEEYPGRGYLEALGIGLEPEEGDILIRGNFATLGSNGNVIDRRAGRDETGLNEFAEKLDGMEIDGIRFNIKRSSGHRVVIIIKGRNISDKIVPNDPKKVNVPLPQIKPKEASGKFTASVLNKFIYKVNKILVDETINKKRKFPANTILIRDIGKKRIVSSFEERFNLKACCIAGIPIAKGVARFLGMDVIEVPGATGRPNTDLGAKSRAVIESLKKYDLVFLHINGTDVLSHDKKPEEKTKFIEKIDEEIGKIMKSTSPETVFIITCDHRTVSDPEFKEYEHVKDPVPILVSGDGIKPDNTKTFDENSAERGSLRIETTGLIPFILKIIC